MRAEDKRIGVDHDAAEVDQTRRQDRAQVDERLLETSDDRADRLARVQEAQAEHCSKLMAVLQAVFRRDKNPTDGLTGFSDAEVEALRYLEAAVRGRDPKLTHVVYAEDRRDLLEQALAILYPTLSHGLQSGATALHAQHDQLVEHVTSLRGHLSQLEDAQEDPIELRQRVQEEEAAGDGDKDDDDKGDGDGDGDGTDAAPARDDDEDDDELPPGDVGDPGVAP